MQAPVVDTLLTELFGLPRGESLQGDFSCGLSGRLVLHGRLYVTNNFVCFYSNLFNRESKRVVRISNISRIRKRRTAYVIPALELTIDDEKVSFGSFFSGGRDRCYKLLFDALVERGVTPDPPRKESANKLMEGEDLDTEPEPEPVPAPASPAPARVRDPEPATPEGAAQSDGQLAASLHGVDTSPGLAETVSVTTMDALEGMDASFPPVPDDFWSTLKSQHEVLRSTIDVAPAEFFETFVAVDAKFAFLDYHRTHGDFEIEFTPWVGLDEADPKAGLCRTVRFRTPLSGAFLPSSTAVEQAQQYRRYQGDVYVYDFSNRTFDVPYGDYFTTQDRWVISPNPGGGCQLLITNNVVFNKSTLFKRKIISSSQEGVGKSYNLWLQLAKDALTKMDRGSPLPLPPPALAAAQTPPMSPVATPPPTTQVALPVWAMVFLLVSIAAVSFWAGRVSAERAPWAPPASQECHAAFAADDELDANLVERLVSVLEDRVVHAVVAKLVGGSVQT